VICPYIHVPQPFESVPSDMPDFRCRKKTPPTTLTSTVTTTSHEDACSLALSEAQVAALGTSAAG
jgi:hypothetical protein